MFKKILFVLLLITTNNAMAQTSNSSNWSMLSNYDNSYSEFRSCFVGKNYPRDQKLMLIKYPDNTYKLTMSLPNKIMEKGQSYKFNITTTRATRVPITLYAKTENILEIPCPNALLQELLDSKSFKMKTSFIDVSFDLDGIDNAVYALDQCVKTKRLTPTDLFMNVANNKKHNNPKMQVIKIPVNDANYEKYTETVFNFIENQDKVCHKKRGNFQSEIELLVDDGMNFVQQVKYSCDEPFTDKEMLVYTNNDYVYLINFKDENMESLKQDIVKFLTVE
jgi:hypothetical protein